MQELIRHAMNRQNSLEVSSFVKTKVDVGEEVEVAKLMQINDVLF
jgi:hypothetical protein